VRFVDTNILLYTIIEASRAMGCAEVLSEEMGDGQDYAGVRVTNPFR
jgi:predicted nucleic acid-binding protein